MLPLLRSHVVCLVGRDEVPSSAKTSGFGAQTTIPGFNVQETTITHHL